MSHDKKSEKIREFRHVYVYGLYENPRWPPVTPVCHLGYMGSPLLCPGDSPFTRKYVKYVFSCRPFRCHTVHIFQKFLPLCHHDIIFFQNLNFRFLTHMGDFWPRAKNFPKVKNFHPYTKKIIFRKNYIFGLRPLFVGANSKKFWKKTNFLAPKSHARNPDFPRLFH